MNTTDQAFTDWFNTKGFKNFNADEFTNYFHVRRRGVLNNMPPRELWENMPPTLWVAEALRTHIGRPIVILSSYRSPAYNKAIGDAAPKSYHMKFQALDLAAVGKSPRQIFTILDKWRDEGKFVGGLGLYNSFVHIDTRGYNATWGI